VGEPLKMKKREKSNDIKKDHQWRPEWVTHAAQKRQEAHLFLAASVTHSGRR